MRLTYTAMLAAYVSAHDNAACKAWKNKIGAQYRCDEDWLCLAFVPGFSFEQDVELSKAVSVGGKYFEAAGCLASDVGRS